MFGVKDVDRDEIHLLRLRNRKWKCVFGVKDHWVRCFIELRFNSYVCTSSEIVLFFNPRGHLTVLYKTRWPRVCFWVVLSCHCVHQVYLIIRN